MWSDSASGVHGTLHVRVGRAEINDRVLKILSSATLKKLDYAYTRHSRVAYYNMSHRKRTTQMRNTSTHAIDRACYKAHRGTFA